MNETINEEVMDLTEDVAMGSNGSGKMISFVAGIVVGIVVPVIGKKTIGWFKNRKSSKQIEVEAEPLAEGVSDED